ncbi:hypothetical protein Bca4012_068540 [Brassica carinata]
MASSYTLSFIPLTTVVVPRRSGSPSSSSLIPPPLLGKKLLVTQPSRHGFVSKKHRTKRIGDEGLMALAKHCLLLQEPVLIGVDATHASLSAIASNCKKLERLALCGSGVIGDVEMAA